MVNLVLLQSGKLKSAAPMQNVGAERARTARYLHFKERRTSALVMENPPGSVMVSLLLLHDTPVDSCIPVCSTLKKP